MLGYDYTKTFDFFVQIRARQVDFAGKRLQAELLVRLRDLAGMTYREISEVDIFTDLQYESLRQLYHNAHKDFYGD